MSQDRLKEQLDAQVRRYNNIDFIADDPISIPHLFADRKNIEIMGFWVAMLSWGQRKTIINKGKELIELMDGNPYDFIQNHEDSDLKRLLNFKHRTFNDVDTLYFISFFKRYFKSNDSLESAFIDSNYPNQVKEGLMAFHHRFFDSEFAPKRTRKHVSTPSRNSACKRLNMFLRWMVRKDEQGVDFGIWNQIKMEDLYIPLDVHVFNVAQELGILQHKKADWKGVEELTQFLKQLDPKDPVRYDYALFSMGIAKNKK